MIRAVLDTNVFISSLFWRGAPYEIVKKGFAGAFVMITSKEILKEVEQTLTKKFQFPTEDTHAFLKIIALSARIVESKSRLAVVSADPDDNKIIECAVSGQADYIISGDKDLLDLKKYQQIGILPPAAFLKMLLRSI